MAAAAKQELLANEDELPQSYQLGATVVGIYLICRVLSPFIAAGGTVTWNLRWKCIQGKIELIKSTLS